MKKLINTIVLALALLSVSVSASPDEQSEIPPPKDMAELQKMMRFTWDQTAMPPGANSGTVTRLLTRGEMVLMNDRPVGIPWMTTAVIMVDAPAALVFNTAVDVEHLNTYVPMAGQCHQEPVPNFPNLYRVTLRMQLLFNWLTIDYGTYDYRRPPDRSDWCHRVGKFEVDSGSWEMVPADGDKRTMAFYSVFARPRMSAVQSLYRQEPALELMSNVATGTMLARALKTEAERRSGRRLPPLRETMGVEQILMQDTSTLRLLAERGKVLVLEPGPTVYVTGAIIVRAPIERAFQVVTDFTHYPQFLPGYDRVVIVGQGARGPIISQDVSIKLWEFNFEDHAKIEMELAPPDRVTWKIPRQSAGTAVGFWRFVPLDNNSRTLIFTGNTQDIRSMGFVPSTALRIEPSLEYGLLAAQMVAGLDAFKKRIEQKPK
jgi:ribosome-associated toxin RatA of RatAB toxin-antitoxin module